MVPLDGDDSWSRRWRCNQRHKYYDFDATAVAAVVVIGIVIAIIQSSRIILGEEQRSLDYHNTSEIIMSRKPIKGFNGSLTGSAVGPAQLL